MVTCGSYFLVADVFDAVIAVIDVDVLKNGTEIRGKFCCRKPAISKELWTTSQSYLLQNLLIRIRIVETLKIKTSQEFVVQRGLQQIKIQIRYFSAEVINS